MYVGRDNSFHGDIPQEKFNIIMRCAYFGKNYVKENLQIIENYCLSNNKTANFLNSCFKNCLVSKKIVYQNSQSAGMNFALRYMY